MLKVNTLTKRHILFDFFTVTYRNKIRKINWIKARLPVIGGVTVLGVNQFRKYKQRNPPDWCNVKEVWFDSQQPLVMGRSIVWRLRETNYPSDIVDLPFSGRDPRWGGGGGTMYVGDPGDSLEKCLYIDFSSTVVLIALYRTKRSSQMIDSIASTHFLRDVAIADDGDDPDDNI